MILRRFIRVGVSDVRAAITTISGVEPQFAKLKLVQPFSECSTHMCSNEDNPSAVSLPTRQEARMERPKTPLKPFIRFSMKYRSLFKAKYPDATHTEIVKRLGMVWNQMSNDDRSVYFDTYAKDYDEYYEHLCEYKTHFNRDYQKYLDEKLKKQRNKGEVVRKRMLRRYFKMPPKPVNPFLMFAAEKKIEENVTTKTRLESQMWLTEMGKVWKTLTEKRKKIYREKFLELSKVHEDVIIEWEKEVVEAGYAFLLPEPKRIDFQPTNKRYGKKSRDEQLRLDSAEDGPEEVSDGNSSKP